MPPGTVSAICSSRSSPFCMHPIWAWSRNSSFVCAVGLEPSFQITTGCFSRLLVLSSQFWSRLFYLFADYKSSLLGFSSNSFWKVLVQCCDLTLLSALHIFVCSVHFYLCVWSVSGKTAFFFKFVIYFPVKVNDFHLITAVQHLHNNLGLVISYKGNFLGCAAFAELADEVKHFWLPARCVHVMSSAKSLGFWGLMWASSLSSSSSK